MKGTVKIGTRDSRLAIWQASQVEKGLRLQGFRTEIAPVKSQGDLDLITPLYEMDVQGVFTRYLDAAVLNKEVDIAVHSMKDVPTILAKGLTNAAILKRGPVRDLLLYKQSVPLMEDFSADYLIATGSVRRRAQWLHRYPNSRITNLRGNVNTRLQKFEESNWDGALFAAAGLERLGLRPEKAVELDWMLPAPAQGAILAVCRSDNEDLVEACHPLNDASTALCVRIERDFLRVLKGGCATPISALARIMEGRILFEGNVLTPDGERKAAITKKLKLEEATDLGMRSGIELLANGGQEIVDQL